MSIEPINHFPQIDPSVPGLKLLECAGFSHIMSKFYSYLTELFRLACVQSLPSLKISREGRRCTQATLSGTREDLVSIPCVQI